MALESEIGGFRRILRANSVTKREQGMQRVTEDKRGDNKQSTGAAAEQRAADYLMQQGLKLVTRNFRCRGGEIDLVMRDGATLVFVEVRARARADFGGAAASITPTKQARIILAARHYLAQNKVDAPCRFDAVLLQAGQLQWLRAAFET
jgi:putative endonuclease